MARRVDLPKSNLRERRRRRRSLLVALSIGLVVVVFAAIAGSTWLPFLRIRAIDIIGAKTVQQQSVVSVVQQQLYGGYLHLFARSNIFLYPKATITQSVLTEFPTFASVEIHAENFHTIGVTVVERTPAALWCGLQVASSSSCFLIDQSGIVYAPAVVYSGDAYQRYYGAVVGATLPQQFLSPVQFHSLTSLVDVLQQKVGASARSILVDDDQDVYVTFENGFELIFALGDDSGDVFDAFGLALQSDPFKAHALTDFEYLDLRFGDKLYYKLKSRVSDISRPMATTSITH